MRVIKVIFLSLAILLTINCCSPNTEKNNLSTHKIIFLTPYYEAYIKAYKTLDEKTTEIYSKKILEVIVKTYFSKCEALNYFEYKQSDTAKYFIKPLELSKILELLNSKQQTITERINSALVKCYSQLKYDSVNVFIFPDAGFQKEITKKMGGIGGLTVGSKQIILTADPTIKGWQDLLEIAVAHEFHHTYWMKHNFKHYGITLLDKMITEGKAEVFSHLIYPNIKEPWDNTLTETQKKALWTKIKPHLNSTDFSLQDNIMFGYNGYPFCCGYILGRDIVSAALKKDSHIEVKNWTNFSPEYILKTSGY